MLDLAGLAEQVDKLLTALDLQRRLGSRRGPNSWPSRAFPATTTPALITVYAPGLLAYDKGRPERYSSKWTR